MVHCGHIRFAELQWSHCICQRLVNILGLRLKSYGGGGVLPHKRLMGMCRWMGSHFQDWIDRNRVAFIIALLEWGHTFSDFWGKTVLHLYG